MTLREDGSIAFTPPYTPEEQALVDRYRRNVRLQVARENYEQARDRYFELKALDEERRREDVVVY